MPHARRTSSPGSTRPGSLAVVWLLLGCGDADTPAAAVAAKADVEEAERGAERAVGDPLLQRAREGIREGMLPDSLRAEVLGSTVPAHARAQRVLLAMAEPPPGSGEATAADEADDARSRPPPILPPILPPTDAAAVPDVAPPTDGPAAGQRPVSSTTADRPVRSTSRADVGGLALRTSKRGATLTIAASSSLVVGVANQPASGLVRLMIESAHAGAGVLRARPKTDGAAVTGVRQGQGTVQITVQLEPGWTLGSVQPFSGGAKVHLVAPP